MEGRAVWRGTYGEFIFEGRAREGERYGRGTIIWSGSSPSTIDRFEGEWRDGNLHGHVVFIWRNGDRFEGEFRNGKPNGYGTFSPSSGSRFEGEWRDGCFGEREGRWAALFTTAAACGFE